VNQLLIVDGHAYAYRAFHAIRELRAPDGQPTNAIYGFVKMLEKMRATVEPTHMKVVWDGGLSVERMELLPDYKAQRPEMPADLRPQLDGIASYLAAAGIAQFCGDGIEADDYIASLARRAAAAGWSVVIASSDKDFMQLVSARIGLLNPNDKSGAVWTAEQVVAKTGVSPEQVADWLALMGDAVDNIPGVPGVGPKTATSLLQEFGSVENLLGRLNEVKSEKLREALRSAAATIRRNQKLVRLPDVPCEFASETLRLQSADVPALRGLFAGWGFRGMLAGLDAGLMQRQAELI
jgi:DNA polymerase I